MLTFQIKEIIPTTQIATTSKMKIIYRQEIVCIALIAWYTNVAIPVDLY